MLAAALFLYRQDFCVPRYFLSSENQDCKAAVEILHRVLFSITIFLPVMPKMPPYSPT